MTKNDLLWLVINSDKERDRARIAREETELSRSMRIALMDDESPLVKLEFIGRDDITAAELIYLCDDDNIVVSDEAKSHLRRRKYQETDKTQFIVSLML